MAIAVYLAIVLPQTIWRLLEIKLELLIQIAPPIFLGLFNNQIKAKSIFFGMLVGTLFALGVMISNKLGVDVSSKPWGIHAGVWGLLINITTVFVLERINKINPK